MTSDIEARTIKRISWRLIPFLIVCYFVAYLDRVNVGFASLSMNKDLGISATAYGLGAGLFFITYFIFEVPSNLALEKFGARRWIARIMLSWGLISGGMAFIGGEASFFIMRLLLGAAEAGFFPGIIFYLTLWFPAAYRARIVSLFMVAIPLSSVIGSPISGLLLELDGVLGFKGWQWLYVIEALPAVVLSVMTYFYLTDRPADAQWLAPDERAWLEQTLAAEAARNPRQGHVPLTQEILNPRVLAIAVVYFGAVALLYAFGFFLPQIFKGFGLTNAQTGFVMIIPYAVGTVGMLWWGKRSDAKRERRHHLAAALACASLCTVGAALVGDPIVKVVLFSGAALGIFGALPITWTLPTETLSGAAAAGAIAVVNSIGNLSGFVAPYAVGAIKDWTGSFTGGLLLIACAGIVGMITVLRLSHTGAPAVPGRVGAAAE
ncbi:membrane protein [Methylobacterium indicum]|uniref:MFS transporter n=1 Tax=Methylobacterium indicum TaxID=1775910 RepID=A0A0J6TPV8_9HYPH|nr:MFS transporter [Methylobacterium indicum]KMO14476.1 membrane protein [Methylobacterium indicum]KMO23402.1 membrane protein [Methylobacterium indicum]KTS30987.1 membrane protein [Methylobacterium indicum]KTS42486.1 membrane protein [Methylobacterium indicum]KTS43178.1 membrane protein [Methylobacterium indicum]